MMLLVVFLGLFAFIESSKLNEPQVLSRYLNPPQAPETFSWSNCNSNDPAQLLSLTLQPDPISLGQNVTLGFKASTSVAINTGHSLILKIWKKIFGVWTDIPCVEGIGSCTYSDLCQFLEENVEPQCPPILATYNIPCVCPFTATTYSLPPVNIITINPGYDWLTSGDFSAQATVNDNSGNEVVCVLGYFSLA